MLRLLRAPALCLFLLALLSGCSLIVSSKLSDKKGDLDGAVDESDDGGLSDGDTPDEDAGPSVDCTEEAKGTVCGLGKICFGMACIVSECGDGYTAKGLKEQCDEGENKDDDNADGCTNACQYSCDEDADCTSGDECNGIETCDTAMHTCKAGTPKNNGDTCAVSQTETGTCQDEHCAPVGCGNSTKDTGEECDPSVGTVGEGTPDNCTTGCMWKCKVDAQCSVNLCEPSSCTDHQCVAGTPVTCTPSDTCKRNVCVPTTGECNETFKTDKDKDGYSGIACTNPALAEMGVCDNDDKRNPGLPDVCDDGVDNNCDGIVDNSAGTFTWYRDVDGDGYGDTMMTRMQCKEPGGYVLTGGDCADDPNNWIEPTASYPGQMTFFNEPRQKDCSVPGGDARCWDYDCNNTVTVQYPVVKCTISSCTRGAPVGFMTKISCGDYAPLYTCDSDGLFGCVPTPIGKGVGDYQRCH